MGLSRKLAPLAVLAGALFAPAAATAGLVTLTYSGTIRTVASGFAPLAGVSAGTRFTGTLIYDDAAVDRDPATGVGQYIYGTPTTPPLAPPLGFSLELENGLDIVTAYTSIIQVQVLDDSPNTFFGQDIDAFVFDQGTRIGGVDQVLQIRSTFGLADTTRTAFSTDALPAALSLAPFNFGVIQIQDLRGNPAADVLLEASIDGLAFPGASAVPEPASMAMLGVGLAGVLATARRRRAA